MTDVECVVGRARDPQRRSLLRAERQSSKGMDRRACHRTRESYGAATCSSTADDSGSEERGHDVDAKSTLRHLAASFNDPRPSCANSPYASSITPPTPIHTNPTSYQASSRTSSPPFSN